MPTTILLIRHAHSTMAGRFCGHLDALLSDAGKAQLADIVRYVERWPISTVYTSDLKRAYDTAAAIASPRFLPLVSRTGLREISFGDWEGRSWSEIEATAPRDATAWLADYPSRPAPGGESLAQFQARVEAEMQAIAGEANDQCFAAVTHAGFVRVAIAKTLGIDDKFMHKIEIGFGGVTILRRQQQDWFLEGVNLGTLPSSAGHEANSESSSHSALPLYYK